MLQLAVDWLIYRALRFPAESKSAAVLNFFLYDSVKILALLFFMIAAIGVLRTFLPERKIKAWVHQRGGWSYFLASLFGALTPFCSCSSIPIFLSFLKTGIPLGVTFSFLITSPLINEYLVVLMLGFFGVKITAAYILSGLLIGIISGFLLGKMNLEKYLADDMVAPAQDESRNATSPNTLKERILFGIGEARSIVKKLWLWVLAGVGIGAFIHNYIPDETVQAIAGRAGIFSVPVVTLVGIPMYGSCAAIVPVAVVLFQKGIPLGTALAFMMAVSALSLPEAIMLRRAMRLPLIAAFFAITGTAIMLTGYLFNFLQNRLT